MEVVADGTSVAVRDRKLATQDLYFIAQTPLKFLLREKIDLARDLTVNRRHQRSGRRAHQPGGSGDARRHLEDPAVLRCEMKTLSQWRITDPQGYITTVPLSNLQKPKSVDAGLFFINYGRAEDKAMQQQIQQSQPN